MSAFRVLLDYECIKCVSFWRLEFDNLKDASDWLMHEPTKCPECNGTSNVRLAGSEVYYNGLRKFETDEG